LLASKLRSNIHRRDQPVSLTALISQFLQEFLYANRVKAATRLTSERKHVDHSGSLTGYAAWITFSWIGSDVVRRIEIQIGFIHLVDFHSI